MGDEVDYDWRTAGVDPTARVSSVTTTSPAVIAMGDRRPAAPAVGTLCGGRGLAGRAGSLDQDELAGAGNHQDCAREHLVTPEGDLGTPARRRRREQRWP